MAFKHKKKEGFKKNFILISILILNFLTFNLSLGEHYSFKNKEELKVLEKIKSQNIIIGLKEYELYTRKSKYNNMSINDIIIEMFNDYLGLNAKFEIRKHDELIKDFDDKKIQGISLMGKSEKRRENFEFTVPIYTKPLYIVSAQKKLSSLSSLEGEKIYITSNVLYKEFIEDSLFNKNLQAEIIEVNDLSKYKDEFIVTINPEHFNTKYVLKVGNSTNTAIGFNHELASLIPIVDRVLISKYRNLINKQHNLIQQEMVLENFYSSLTEKELKYLKELKEIKVAYNKDLDSDLYYVSKDKEIEGIIPDIFEIIGNAINVEIVDTNVDSLKDLSKYPAKQVYILSKAKSRSKSLVFSDKISNINTYIVKLKKAKDTQQIGVVRSSIEEEVLKKYTLKDNLKQYPDYDSLIKALNKGEIQQILTTNIKKLNVNLYDIYFYEDISVSLAFKKEDILLRNVISKAISNMVLLDEVISNSLLKRTNSTQLELRREYQKKIFFITLSLGLLILLICSIRKSNKDKKLKLASLRDPVSGFPNRIVFNDFLNEHVEEGYVFTLKLNGLDDINDVYYQKIEDRVITELSKFLSKNFGESKIFKTSSDKFQGVFKENIKEIIERFKSYTSNNDLFIRYGITCSLGLYDKKCNDSMETSIKNSNIAMIKAKNNSGFSFYTANKLFLNKIMREEKILCLLNEDLKDLYPVFQPKINLKTKKIIGAETLARMYSDKLGFISPIEFIVIAENYNLIHKIDYKMAEESLALLRRLIDSKKIEKGFRLSFNLSSKTFNRGDLIENIERWLIKYNVSGEYIEIEITESLLIKDINKVINKLNKFKELGIQISLDDFSAGHSTARLLPILPIDIVKLDKSLLDSFHQNRSKAEIVYLRLISLMKDLDVKIVAEGIETENEFDFLSKNGVEYGQGYFIGKPDKELSFIPFKD